MDKSIGQRTLLKVTKYKAIANGILALTSIILSYVAIRTFNQAKENARIELRAYIQIVDAIITQMEVGKTLEITIDAGKF